MQRAIIVIKMFSCCDVYHERMEERLFRSVVIKVYLFGISAKAFSVQSAFYTDRYLVRVSHVVPRKNVKLKHCSIL